VDVFQLALAVKPTNISPNKKYSLKKLLGQIVSLGYSHLIIDSERASDDISLTEFEELLSEGWSLEIVLTIPVRRSDFEERFAEVVEVLKNHDTASACLVAGNPAYLSDYEAALKAGPLIMRAAETYRRELGRRPLYIGSEKMVKTAVKAAFIHKASPIVLYNGNLNEELRIYPANDVLKGVYIPFYFGESMDEDVMGRLKSYVERRNSELPFERALKLFCLVGSIADVAAKIDQVAAVGAGLLAGHPFKLDAEQVRMLATALAL